MAVGPTWVHSRLDGKMSRKNLTVILRITEQMRDEIQAISESHGLGFSHTVRELLKYAIAAEADARLIAAAPELLHALKIAKDNWDYERMPDEYDFICAAIAKAEGK